MNEEFIGSGKINFDNEKTQRMRSVNSTLFFVLSFVIVDFINNVFIFLMASSFGLKTNLKYHTANITEGLDFLKVDSKFIIFTSGTIACIAIGIVSLIFYHKIKKKAGFYKLFFVWLSFNSFFAVLTRFAFAELYPSGWFSKSLLLLKANSSVYITLRVIAGILAICMALYFSRLFLQTTNTKKYLKDRIKRRKYFSQIVVIPWMVGSVASYFFFFPNTDLIDALHFMSLSLPILTIYFYLSNKSLAKTYLHRYPSNYKLNSTALIIFILVYIEFHVFLVNGVHF